jgi:hypothetical protein
MKKELRRISGSSRPSMRPEKVLHKRWHCNVIVPFAVGTYGRLRCRPTYYTGTFRRQNTTFWRSEILGFRTLSIVRVFKNKLRKNTTFRKLSENPISLKVIHHRQNPIATFWRIWRFPPNYFIPASHKYSRILMGMKRRLYECGAERCLNGL